MRCARVSRMAEGEVYEGVRLSGDDDSTRGGEGGGRGWNTKYFLVLPIRTCEDNQHQKCEAFWGLLLFV